LIFFLLLLLVTPLTIYCNERIEPYNHTTGSGFFIAQSLPPPPPPPATTLTSITPFPLQMEEAPPLGFNEVPEFQDDSKSSSNSRKLVPWLNWNEWLFVRDSLFSDSPNSFSDALKRVTNFLFFIIYTLQFHHNIMFM